MEVGVTNNGRYPYQADGEPSGCNRYTVPLKYWIQVAVQVLYFLVAQQISTVKPLKPVFTVADFRWCMYDVYH
jgi:hypothetical protein